MIIKQIMDAYQNGLRNAVHGPLDFLQVQELIKLQQQLMLALSDMLDMYGFKANSNPLPDEHAQRTFIKANAALHDAEALLGQTSAEIKEAQWVPSR